jgi:hypothetical protein
MKNFNHIGQKLFARLSFVIILLTAVAIFSISINAQAVGQIIEDDPIVQANLELSKAKVTIQFKEPKNLKSIINLIQKSSSSKSQEFIAYYLLEFNNVNLELPVQLSTNDNLTNSKKNLLDSQSTYLNNLLSSKQANKTDTFTLGENQLSLEEFNSKVDTQELNQKLQYSENLPKIAKVTFTLPSASDYIKSLQNKDNNKDSDKKALKTKKVATNISNDDAIKQIQPLEIESLRQKGYSEQEKQQVLEQAKQAKAQIAQRKLDAIETAKAKLEKDKRVAKTKEERKAKKKEIKNKVLQGKGSEVSLDDVYLLGEEGKDFGLEILPPEKDGQTPRIKQENNKIRNYKEDKTVIENVVETLGNLLGFSSLQAEAFSPEFYGEHVYHATPKAHMGTGFDLFGANSANGTTIGTWSNHNGWNQKFNLQADDTIRIAGKCLDLNWNNRANGEKIQLWDCNGGPAQKWTYDTAGRIKLKDNSNWCLDNDYGIVGARLYLWQCTNNTERWRPGSFEMRLYSRTGPSSPGHAFVQLAQFDGWNNVIANTTYSLWPSWQGRDVDSSNSNTQYKEANDRSQAFWYDDRWVNKDVDLADGYDATQHANYRNNTAYWLKWIPQWSYNNIVNWGYKIDPYVYIVIDNCATYSTGLWINNGGRPNYYSPSFGWWSIFGEIPQNLTYILYTDYSY